MTYLNKLSKYPIDLSFVSNYYGTILFSHPKKLKLIMLFITHMALILFLYVSPLFYDNKYYNIFYVCLTIAMVCGWILFNGECWINSWEKKILNPNYKNGDNLDVNPSIDYISQTTTSFFINLFNKNNKNNNIELINDDNYSYNKNLRYKIPLIVPLFCLILILSLRFKNLKIEYKFGILLLLVFLIIITHFRWKHIDPLYK